MTAGSRLPLLLLLSLPAGAACAQSATPADYPNRVVRVIVPRGTGGLVDVVARLYAENLAGRIGQQVIIDNRPGAGGTIAGEAVTRAVPDGYTIFVSAQDTQVLTPILRKKPPYDPVRDFTHISLIFTTPLHIFVHPTVPAKSVQELVAIARANPGKLTYASLGVGSTQHLAAELFKSRLKLDIVHIPYKSTAQATIEQLAGQVDINFTAGITLFPHVDAGKLRAIASTGSKRSLARPKLPTVAESGVPGYEMEPWYGLSGPAGLPAPIVDRLNRENAEVLRSAPVRDRFRSDGLEARPTTPGEFTARIKAEIPLWTKIMREAGVPSQ
ncbi:MAG: tripartite tricarboxylate transporter substrate binding protein [Burkholderiales bacterium]|nr:tripartite tricarboxylate transporter substrate binding protein [Burkholderiales bacterium]